MRCLAFDLGASSGRAVIGELNGGTLKLTEIHRFANNPVQVGNHLYWDILRLYHEVKQGILKARQEGYEDIQSIGIDSWAVDFGLLDEQGELLGNPYHYRDHQTAGAIEEVSQLMKREEIYARTGIQFQPFNTIYQLHALQKRNASCLGQAKTLLMIPDLLRYFLTGERKNEFTNLTTTQLYNPTEKRLDPVLLEKLGLSEDLFPGMVQPGTLIAPLKASICEELGIDEVAVIAVAEHDTASAVVAVPAVQGPFAYLSCGTWSLIGTELPAPVLDGQAMEWNFTNEGGIGSTYRFLKNIMGLWLVQECKREWDKQGNSFTFAELAQHAEDARPFRSLIDPDDSVFLNPAHMPQEIQNYCANTKQPIPGSPAEIIRCITESLALQYRASLERIEAVTGQTFAGLHMVGGGIQNELLCQFTANALGRPVWAGPTEGSAIGNLVVQFMAMGQIQSIQEVRALVRHSFPVKTYEPQNGAQWEQTYENYRKLIGI